MLNKFMFLTSYGLKKKLKSKAFIIANIVLFILLVSVINVDSIINFFGGDFADTTSVYIIENDTEAYDLFKENYEKLSLDFYGEQSNFNIVKATKELSLLQEEIVDTNDIIIAFNSDLDNYLNVKVISDSYIDTFTYQTIVQSINNTKYVIAVNNSDIPIEELNKISNPVLVERILINQDKTAEEENINVIMSVVFPVLILPFFMFIVLLVQFIGSEINEEKTTRSMEVIISNVSAKVHFFSKLVTNNIFVIMQAILLFLYVVIGFFIRSKTGDGISGDFSTGLSSVFSSLSSAGVFDKLVYIIPLTIVLMILSFVAYSLIAGVLASMTVNAEDFQQVQTPIMIICVISYYLSFMSSMFEGSLFIKIMSYIPLISCLLSPALLIVGQIGIFDVIISIVIMILFVLVLSKYGLRVYKVGILNYSTDGLWNKMFKAIKKE
jgi:ABC-2 type transport system permease protein